MAYIPAIVMEFTWYRIIYTQGINKAYIIHRCSNTKYIAYENLSTTKKDGLDSIFLRLPWSLPGTVFHISRVETRNVLSTGRCSNSMYIV